MLYQAVMDNDADAVRPQLLSQEVDVNVKAGPAEETPLHLAVKNGHREITELLVNYPSNLNVKNKQGKTALQIAVGNCDHEIERILLEAKADIKTADSNGKTLMHEAAASANDSMIEYLASRNVNVNAADKFGMTPLHVAAGQNKGRSHLSTIETLFLYGADPLALDLKFNKPIDYLVKEPHHEVTKRLCDRMVAEILKIRVRRPLKIKIKGKKEAEEKTSEENKVRAVETERFDGVAEIKSLIAGKPEKKAQEVEFEDFKETSDLKVNSISTTKQDITSEKIQFTVLIHLSVFFASILMYFLFYNFFHEL